MKRKNSVSPKAMEPKKVKDFPSTKEDFLNMALSLPSEAELQSVPERFRPLYALSLTNACNLSIYLQRLDFLQTLNKQFPKSPYPTARMAFLCAAMDDAKKAQNYLTMTLTLAAGNKTDHQEIQDNLFRMAQKERTP